QIVETAFKKETIGLVTREWYVEKRVNIHNKIEEEEKEKLQKLQQERASLCVEFTLMLPEGNHYKMKFGSEKLGKDPTVESSFLPDRYGIYRSKRNENDYGHNSCLCRI
ncbi:unnamed protein product, partial [Musa textilis]